jgi:hypothetical protein
MTLEKACDLASELRLDPSLIFIEPSRYSGFLFHNPSAATYFRVAFNAASWPTKSVDVHFMYVCLTPEIAAWLRRCGYEYEHVEIVAVLFGCEKDQERFEGVLWPGQDVGAEIC